MRYAIRQHLLSLGDDFTIRDEAGAARYVVRGRAFAIGDKLSFQDMQGSELLFIRQKVLSFVPTYWIERDGATLATVTKELFTFVRSRFEVDVPGPDDYHVEGDFLEHEYAVSRPSRGVVARISKRFFSIRDHYGVDIVPGEDDLLLLATVIVIDQVCHEKR